MALVIISIGTIQAFLLSLCTIFNPSPIGNHFHYIYLQYARYLVGGLTFQLAADIIESKMISCRQKAQKKRIELAIPNAD